MLFFISSKHVLTEDILSRYIKNERLYTRRLLTKTNAVPKWGERFIPSSTRKAFIIEESVVDPKAKTITTYTRNIALQSIMVSKHVLDHDFFIHFSI